MMERTLLLVDDEENIVSCLVRSLRRDGYKILCANSGKEGLALLEKNRVGVIISDQRMSEMNGTEFLGKVKERYPDTIRILLSGYTELNSVTDAINRGAVYKFLTKPWEDDLLRANVSEAFQRYEMRMENERLAKELQQANKELLQLNKNLELRVDEKTREVTRNLNVLRVSQEILEYLPVAVIGIGEDGIIAIANQMAHQLFGAGGARTLLGEAENEVLPGELSSCIPSRHQIPENSIPLRLADGLEINCWCKSTGAHSLSKGTILVIDPGRHYNMPLSGEQ